MAKSAKTHKFETTSLAASAAGPLPLRRSFWMLLILIAGFVLRVYQLEIKPVHFDEGINGHFVATMWKDGFYKYDPTNFHGPLYFYILMLAEKIFGFGIFGYRFVTGLINLAAIYVVGLHRRFVGRTAIYAALILALSPAFTFYSRYAIHESLFILAQVLFSYGYFLYREEKSLASLWWMAGGLITLITTKETFFIFLATWVIAVGLVKLFDQTALKSVGFEEKKKAPEIVSWVAVSLVSVVVILALFTGFFLSLQGARDMLAALTVWTHTGTAHTGHEKVFLYFAQLLRRFEWPCFIGLIASPVVFFSGNRVLRVLALTGFGTWLAYSLIPYKTPWLILNALWPLSFCAGAIIARVMPSFKFWRGLRSGVALLTFAAIFFSMRETLRLNFKDFAAVNEPYVYVQSTLEFKRAVDTVFSHLRRRPEDVSMKVFAMNRDSWPLPYLLRPLANVSWGHAPDTDLQSADVVFADQEDRDSVEARLSDRYFVLPFKIRDAYQDGQAYLRASVFEGDVPKTTPFVQKVSVKGEAP